MPNKPFHNRYRMMVLANIWYHRYMLDPSNTEAEFYYQYFYNLT